jgi:hypothetical protein
MGKIAQKLRDMLGLHEMNRELKHINKRLTELESQVAMENKWRGHFTGKVNALLRHAYLEDFLAEDYPAAATANRFKLYSQNEEDGIVLGLLRTVGITNRTFVEIGSGGSGGNSGMLCNEFGWRGVMVDYSKTNIDRASKKFGSNPKCSFEHLEVTPENVDSLIQRNGLTGEVDFFSLDIDSFDYWVLKAMTACSPRVMCLEYNSNYGATESLTIAPDTDMAKAPKGFHGVSLKAWEKLCAERGYRLVACDPTGTNAFFLRNDLRPDIKALPAEKAFRPQMDNSDPMGQTERSRKDLKALADQHGLSLVEV